MFVLSFALHFYGSLEDENKALSLKKLPLETQSNHISDSRFWFESFQNWQSEFLSVFAIISFRLFASKRIFPIEARWCAR